MDMHRLKNGGEKKEGDAVSQTSSHQRRKRSSDRSKPSSGYLQEWVHQSRSFVTAPHYDPQYSQLVGPYWEVAGSPRMYAAFSDPTVCRYSVPTAPPPPLAYSYEPVSLPIYQPAYQPVVPPPSVGTWRSPQHVPSQAAFKPEGLKQATRQSANHSSKRTNRTISSRRHVPNSPLSQHQTLQGAATQEEYLSLPPGTQQGCDLDDSHRRFSDPGLARTESDSVPANNGINNNNNNLDEENESGEWSHDSSNSSAGSANYETVALSEQLNLLKADNKRLSQELRDTRAELHKLKLQAATWGNPIQHDYQPGMITDLVREIRDAAQLREETLLSRLRLMMADGGVLRLTGSNATEKESSSSIHNRETNMIPQDSSFSEELRDSERISRLERQLNNMQLHNGNEASRREDQLRRELQEAQAARRMAESNVNKLEKLMNMMRKKMNGVTGSPERDGDPLPRDTAPPSLLPLSETPTPCVCPPALGSPTAASASATAPSSLESLTSACSSHASQHGPAATAAPPAAPLSGPVTDL